MLIYVRFLGFAHLPTAFSEWLGGLEYSPLFIMICILLSYAVLGMFMDAIGMMLLTLPIVFPAVIALNGGEGVEASASTFGMTTEMCAIWFGILVVKMAEFLFDYASDWVELFCRCGRSERYFGSRCFPWCDAVLFGGCVDDRILVDVSCGGAVAAGLAK